MRKKFNVTGICYPEDHYMMDKSAKLQSILEMIEYGEYFTINRPRQYGKTTMLYNIGKELRKQGEYLVIELNFQGIDSSVHESDAAFARMFVDQLIRFLKFTNPELTKSINEISSSTINDMDDLSDFVTDLVKASNKKIILLIDEVDASSNYLPFLSFLAMLRTKYLARKRPHHATFNSIVLAGVHDIKSLKYKLRNPEDATYNSPWNIATDFEVDMTFNPKEIAPMLQQYCAAEGVTMDIPAIAERLHYHTSGYPFLVSKLCKNIVDKILKKRSNQKEWTLADVEASVQLILKENNTNFDSLINNIENHKALYNLVYEVLIKGEVIPYNPDEPIVQLGRMYGVFKKNGRLKIHNRIYEQRIYNYLAAKTLIRYLSENPTSFGDTAYVNKDGTLAFVSVLQKFQAFMKVQRSAKDTSFIERQWRLIFLAFLQPIINGKGHDFKEVEISEEKRLDIVVTYHRHKYILELKLWRGAKKHQEGLDQLADYLTLHSIQKGYLIIFDNRKKKTWDKKWISHKGKEIYAVWV